MLVFNKSNMEKSAIQKGQWNELSTLRQQHDMIQANALRGMGVTLQDNAAALLPKDAYQEMDRITKRVFTPDEGQAYMGVLTGIAKSVNIGKTVSIYRQASDKAGLVNRSMSGQVPEAISKTNYTYGKDPVPIFSAGYGREWREQAAFTTEGFDAMFDDHENTMRDLKQDIAQYMLIGDAGIVVDGVTGRGILNHANTQKLDLGASGANIDLTTATADEIVAYFTGPFARALDDNYCMRVDEMFVSPQLNRKLDMPYSTSGGFKEGTIKEYLIRYGRIGKITPTFELGRAGGVGQGAYNADGEGNEFFAFVSEQSALCPLVAQAASVVAIPRLLPMDNVNNLAWAAIGMRVTADANGHSQVFYASEIS